MTHALRGVGPGDFDVIHDGEIVGRIYRMKADRELWRWMIRLWARPPGPRGGFSHPRRSDGGVPREMGCVRNGTLRLARSARPPLPAGPGRGRALAWESPPSPCLDPTGYKPTVGDGRTRFGCPPARSQRGVHERVKNRGVA
jgi:hypothetical protein